MFSGTLPSSSAALTSLEYMDLNGNALSGQCFYPPSAPLVSDNSDKPLNGNFLLLMHYQAPCRPRGQH